MFSNHVRLAVPSWLEGLGPLHTTVLGGGSFTDSKNFKIEGRSLPLSRVSHPHLKALGEKYFSISLEKQFSPEPFRVYTKYFKSGLFSTVVNVCNHGDCTCLWQFSIILLAYSRIVSTTTTC